MCEVLGIDAKSQREKLQNSSWACGVMIPSHDTTGRKQELFCLPVKSVPMWLAGIDAGRVSESVRSRLERFQKDAADALYRWAMGGAPQTLERMTLTVIEAYRDKCAEQERQLAAASPKVDYYDRFAVTDGCLSLRDAAKVLGRHPMEWNEELRTTGYLYRGNDGELRPYAKWNDKGVFRMFAIAVNGVVRQQTMVTSKGMQHFGQRDLPGVGEKLALRSPSCTLGS
jgi:phage antirepressor YoqD-like protein